MSNPISIQAKVAANKIGVKVWETESSFPTSYAESIIQQSIDSAIAEREKEMWRPVADHPLKRGWYVVELNGAMVGQSRVAYYVPRAPHYIGFWLINEMPVEVIQWRSLPTPPEVK